MPEGRGGVGPHHRGPRGIRTVRTHAGVPVSPPRPLTVLLISDSGPGTVGGAEASLDHLVEALRRRGHTAVRAYAEAGPGVLPVGDYLLDLPQPQTRFRVPRPSFLWGSARGVRQLYRVVKAVRPDVVALHYVTARAGYLLALRPLFRYGVVLNARGSDLLRPSRLSRRVLPALLRRADGVIALSEAIAQAAVEVYGAERPPVIYNGVDATFWSPDPHALSSATVSPGPTVVSVGRLEHVKGHDTLVSAFARVRQQVAEARLVVVGGGSRLPQLREQADRLGLAQAVGFAGSLGVEAVRDRLRQADVFVLPSRSEGLSNALLEALATGLPVVASRVGGIPEVLGRGGGVMVPPEDPDALADALADLLVHPDKRRALADDARRNALAWSWDATAAAFERVALDASGGAARA